MFQKDREPYLCTKGTIPLSTVNNEGANLNQHNYPNWIQSENNKSKRRTTKFPNKFQRWFQEPLLSFIQDAEELKKEFISL